jgi:Fe-S-cluster containining protein
MDTRVRGKLTRRLERLAKKAMDPKDYLDPKGIPLPRPRRRFVVPDCANCKSRCCVHRHVGSGILLSLRDVAALVDSGLEELIVGTFTFRRRNGRILPEFEKMPRLAKRQGNCVFYDPVSGLCTQYGDRPTICRRFPYEIDYRGRSEKPFARFISWAPCRKKRGGRELEPAVRQMVEDAVADENVSFEDVVLLPEHIAELRRIGFARFLPPPEECPK